jgi:hypothetical protein
VEAAGIDHNSGKAIAKSQVVAFVDLLFLSTVQIEPEECLI